MTARARGLFLAALITLSACGNPGASPPQVPEAEPKSAQPVNAAREAPESLIGEYWLEGGGVPIIIDETRIRFENCQQVGWTYTNQAGRFSALRARPPLRTTPADAVPPPPCAAPLTPDVAEMARAIDAAVRAEMTPDGDLRLSGGGLSIRLRRQ